MRINVHGQTPLCSWSFICRTSSLFVSCKLRFPSLTSRSTLYWQFFLSYPTFKWIYSETEICIRSEAMLLGSEVHYLYSGSIDVFRGKKRASLSKKKKIKNQRVSSMLFSCWGKEAQRNEGSIRVTHPLAAELHSPTSFLPSLLLFCFILTPRFLLYYFLPETILYYTFNALKPLVDKVATGEIWGQLCEF